VFSDITDVGKQFGGGEASGTFVVRSLLYVEATHVVRCCSIALIAVLSLYISKSSQLSI
jgi:hypothetical protein